MTARAAAATGFAPEVIHAEPGLMVSRFVEGKVLAVADVQADIPRIADLVFRFHRDMPAALSGPGFIFWVFHVNRDYVRQLREAGHAAALDNWLTINSELEQAQMALPVVVGHHDLLPANLIDDGTRLWLIDYEYAGFGTAMFDLANLSSNNNFSADQSATLLDAYFGRPPDHTILKSHTRWPAPRCYAKPCVAGLDRSSRPAGRRLWPVCAREFRQARSRARGLSRTVRTAGRMTVPAHAQVVVIGGGIIGCSTAYHLAKEQHKRTSFCSSRESSPRAPLARCGTGRQLRSSARSPRC